MSFRAFEQICENINHLFCSFGQTPKHQHPPALLSHDFDRRLWEGEREVSEVREKRRGRDSQREGLGCMREAFVWGRKSKVQSASSVCVSVSFKQKYKIILLAWIRKGLRALQKFLLIIPTGQKWQLHRHLFKKTRINEISAFAINSMQTIFFSSSRSFQI